MTKFKILITEICVKTVSDRIIQQRIVGLNSNANIAIKKKVKYSLRQRVQKC
jgi:hypothetical protein